MFLNILSRSFSSVSKGLSLGSNTDNLAINMRWSNVGRKITNGKSFFTNTDCKFANKSLTFANKSLTFADISRYFGYLLTSLVCFNAEKASAHFAMATPSPDRFDTFLVICGSLHYSRNRSRVLSDISCVLSDNFFSISLVFCHADTTFARCHDLVWTLLLVNQH